MTLKEMESVSTAVNLVMSGAVSKCAVNNRINVYKIPSANPEKYIIRIDIKVNQEERK